jgi:UDP-N-acetylmuramoylalanine--D-glutamate ligase
MITERKILALALPDTGDKITTPYRVANMGEAIQMAYEKTPSGGVVLMSPGAPSYNQYKNFEERGEDFIKFVKKLKDKE